MTDQPANINLRLALEQQALRDSQQGVDKLSRQFTDLKKAVTDTGKAADGALRSTGQATSGGFNIEGLRRTGGALSQLGLGVVGEPVQRLGDLAQVFKELTAASAGLGPALLAAGAAGGIFIGGLALIKKEYEAGNAIIEAALPKLDAYFKLIATETTASATQKLATAQKELDSITRELSTTSGSTAVAFKSAQQAYGDLGARVMFALGSTGLYNDTLKDTDAKTQELTKQQKAAQATVDALKLALQDGSLAANDAAIAERELQAVRNAEAEKGITRAVKNAELLASGTSDQATTRLRQVNAEMTAINDTIAKGGIDEAEYKKLGARFHDLNVEQRDLLDTILPAIQAREAETQAIKDSEAALKKSQDTIEKQNAGLAAVWEKYEDKIASIEDQAAQKRADILQQYNDAMVAAAQKAVDAAQSALDKLEAQQADNARSLNRDLDKASRDAADQQLADQVKAQRAERDGLVDHLRRLREIQTSNQASEQQAVWDRNALQLIQLRLAKKQQIDQENTAYLQKRQDAERAAQDEVNDQKRQQSIARRERLIAYQQANEDARRQYQTELTLIAAAKQKEIQIAQAAQVKELTDLATLRQKGLDAARNAATAEVKLLLQTSDARMKLLLAERDKVLELAGMTVNSQKAGSVGSTAWHTTGGVVHSNFASGGFMKALTVGQVNEPGSTGREGWNGQPFPGRGLWIPFQSGTVNPDLGSKQVTNNLTFTINGGDVGMVRREVEAAFQRVMN